MTCPKPSVPLTSPKERSQGAAMSDNTGCDVLAVNFYSRPKLFLIPLNSSPQSLPATQESALVKLKGEKAIKPSHSPEYLLFPF